MPQQLKTISEIAEEQGRMLMLITFGSLVPSTCPFDYLVCEKRRVVLGWLQAEGIRHRACLGVSDTESADAPYLGELYLDLPADTNAPIYQRVCAFMEDQCGHSSHEKATLWLFDGRIARAG
jgi:hypothetical protein